MTGYKATITRSTKELDAKQKIMMKDTTNTVSLDTATQGSDGVIIDVDFAVVLDVHNEKSDNKDYTKYIIVDKNGERYITGSESFWSAFENIYDELADAGIEDYQIKAYRLPSKNYAGRDFLTCALI